MSGYRGVHIFSSEDSQFSIMQFLKGPVALATSWCLPGKPVK